jgi:hypothetical protein
MAEENDTINPYQKALAQMSGELEEIKKQESQLAIRKARLIESFDSLLPLAFPDEIEVEVNSLTLADAIRLAVRSAARPLHVREIRSRLDDMGFGTVRKFKNPMASVHTAVNRMIDSQELVYITDPHDGAKVIEGGPFLKPTPRIADIARKSTSFKTPEATSDTVSGEERVKPDDARSEANPFEKFIGIAGPFPGGEEGIKAWIDDMRSDKDYE